MLKNISRKFKRFFSRSKKLWGIFILIVLLFIPLEFFIFSSKIISNDALYTKAFLANNQTYSVPIPQNLSFADEKVPLYDFTVRESIERELLVNTYFQSQSVLTHKRANRWLPAISAILKKNGVPDDFKYIALIESNLTNSVSPKGAAGFWQFVEGTAKQCGLEMNDEVDERYNLEKSTEAACKYFKDAYKIFGNWTLAAASYNIGMDGLKTQVDKQKASSYYDLALNEETARYIFRVLAVKEVISHPKNYGYMLRQKDLYPPIPTTKISIDSSITDLAILAQKNNVSYKILKYFNPWLRKNSLTNTDKKTYFIEFPKVGYNEEYLARLASSDSLGMRIDSISAVTFSAPSDTSKKQ